MSPSPTSGSRTCRTPHTSQPHPTQRVPLQFPAPADRVAPRAIIPWRALEDTLRRSPPRRPTTTRGGRDGDAAAAEDLPAEDVARGMPRASAAAPSPPGPKSALATTAALASLGRGDGLGERAADRDLARRLFQLERRARALDDEEGDER